VKNREKKREKKRTRGGCGHRSPGAKFSLVEKKEEKRRLEIAKEKRKERKREKKGQ